MFIGNGLAVPMQKMASDLLMSSSCGDGHTLGENHSFENVNLNNQAGIAGNNAPAFMRTGSEVNFQKMGHNGQCNHHYNQEEGQNLLLCKQFSAISGYENMSDNQNSQGN